MPRESNNNNGGNSDKNNWKDALPPGVDQYTILINKN
jgi:hypothetical protein